MLWLYDGAVGVKTGFTKVSGRCLVSAAERDGMLLVAVTLNAPDDWADHTAMLDQGFSVLERRELLVPGAYTVSLPCIGSADSAITIANRDGFTAILTKNEPHDIRQVIEHPQYLWAPVTAGEVVGSIRLYDGDTLLCAVPLHAETDGARITYEKNFFEKLFE